MPLSKLTTDQIRKEESEMLDASEQGHKDIEAMLQKYIGKMYDSLDASSIKYFLETGKINGSFRLNLVRMVFETHYQLSKNETWAVWKEKAEGYEKALERIHHPLKAMQEECKNDGTILDGRMAIQLCDDAAYLRSIATKALEQWKQ